MKTEWLVADVTAVGSPNRAEHTILGVILAWLGIFGQLRPYLWLGSHFVILHSFLSPNNFLGSLNENRVVGY